VIRDTSCLLGRAISVICPDLARLQRLETQPRFAIEGFYTQLGKAGILPTARLVEKLRNMEPLLASLEKKDHYTHMFSCLLLGDAIIDKLYVGRRDVSCQVYKALKLLWLNIAASHDIAYPIEEAETEISEFFEAYFGKRIATCYPVDKTTYFTFGQFPNYKSRILRLLAGRVVKTSEGATSVKRQLDGLTLHYLATRGDHAILSALLLMMAIEDSALSASGGRLTDGTRQQIDKDLASVLTDHQKESRFRAVSQALYEVLPCRGAVERFQDVAGSVVYLHNLHKWRSYMAKELAAFSAEADVAAKNADKTSGSPTKKLADVSRKHPYADFVLAAHARNGNDDTGSVLTEAAGLARTEIDKLKSLSIPDCAPPMEPLKKGSETDYVRFLGLLLAVVDTVQEWGRDRDQAARSRLIAVKGIEVARTTAAGGRQVTLQVGGPKLVFPTDCPASVKMTKVDGDTKWCVTSASNSQLGEFIECEWPGERKNIEYAKDMLDRAVKRHADEEAALWLQCMIALELHKCLKPVYPVGNDALIKVQFQQVEQLDEKPFVVELGSIG